MVERVPGPRHRARPRGRVAAGPALTEARLAAHLARLDRVLSRTVATGRTDRGASARKRPALLTGAGLRARIAANRRLVARFLLWRRRAWPATALEHLATMCTVAHLSGLGLLPEGLFRTWTYDARRHGVVGAGAPVPPAAIGPALGALVTQVAAGRARGRAARVALVARVEWELGIGALHPFYDGCGRISRYVAALLSLWLGVPLVTHVSREAYFAAGRAGLARFVAYYQERTRDAGLGAPAPRRA